jgi:FkbH-like protein
LRRRGVLLSINSKNDANNVHWTGAGLAADDFVAPRINWNPKVANMAAIRDELNLKLKDFVFLDDRPEELERVRNAFPEILALNATDTATWTLLSHWQKNLPSEPDEDRTRQYHDRVKREQFVGQLAGGSAFEDETAALVALQLSVKIAEASRSGLKRAAELVNRTNQFNLCGSRTTARELEDGMGTNHSVITVEAADKFGGMGVVGVMRVDWTPDGIEIPIFVLSCRAFGFGIEYALLNSVKALVLGDHAIAGLHKETQFNQPCRRLYPASGMRWDGQRWIGRIAELPPDPAWLKIESGITAKEWAVPQMAAH